MPWELACRGAQAGIAAAAAACRPSAGRPPLSGTFPMTMLFTVASNLPLSPLVALLVTARTSPIKLICNQRLLKLQDGENPSLALLQHHLYC